MSPLQQARLAHRQAHNPTIPAPTTARPELLAGTEDLKIHGPQEWRACSTGNHQGLIVCETTGANIAVAYDKKDAPLIAAAPALLAALEALLEQADLGEVDDETAPIVAQARAAITQATL